MLIKWVLKIVDLMENKYEWIRKLIYEFIYTAGFFFIKASFYNSPAIVVHNDHGIQKLPDNGL